MTMLMEDRLRSIGFNAQIAQGYVELRSQLNLGGRKLRVVEVHRDRVVLHDGGDQIDARASPSLLRALDADHEPLVVGDWVLAQLDRDRMWWIASRVAPFTRLARRDSEGRRQSLVSNVDSALLVMGLDGNHNLRRLERYLAMVQGAGIWAIIVLTKLDLAAQAGQRIDDVRSRVPASVPVHAVDARSPEVLAEFAPYLG